MISHQLVLAGDRSGASWRLYWDASHFVLEDPDGTIALKVETSQAHRQIDLSLTFIEGTFTNRTEGRKKELQWNDSAARLLRKLLDRAMYADREYRVRSRHLAIIATLFGFVSFVAGTA